jgi:uncharacterized lipoprotein YddW (UPF0748 family)
LVAIAPWTAPQTIAQVSFPTLSGIIHHSIAGRQPDLCQRSLGGATSDRTKHGAKANRAKPSAKANRAKPNAKANRAKPNAKANRAKPTRKPIAPNPVPEVIVPNTVPEVIVPPPFQEIRGVWMTENDNDILRDRAKLHDAVSQLARLNFNTIYPVVWNSGYVLYPSAVAQRTEIQPFVRQGLQGQDILADLAAQAHRQGLLVIPWFEFGFMAPPTSELALNHPDWLTQQRDGSQTSIAVAGEVAWLNPFHPRGAAVHH